MPTSDLVTTPGSASANAYVTLAVADQYHLDRPQFDAVWEEAVHPSKTQAILYATKLLDRLVKWAGQPVTYTQALQWPRFGMNYRNGDYIPHDSIPLELQWATAEYALQLLTVRGASVPGSTTKNQLEELANSARKLGVESVGTPTINLTLGDGASQVQSAVQAIPAEVLDLMPTSWRLSREMTVELLRA